MKTKETTYRDTCRSRVAFIKIFKSGFSGNLRFFLFIGGVLFSSVLFGQVVVDANQNHVPVRGINLDVAGREVIQRSPTGNENPMPDDVPVIIRSLVLDEGKHIFATTKKPNVVNPNPLLGSDEIGRGSVQVVTPNQIFSHQDPTFLDVLASAVSIPDLRSYWDINSQPSIPRGEHFVDLMYNNQVVTSGYLLYSERHGNSATDFIALNRRGEPISGAKVVQVRGWQWNTGVRHKTNVPEQTQWLVLFSPSLFESTEPIHGIRVMATDEPDGKMVFFVNAISAMPDLVEQVDSEIGGYSLINIFENDELNGLPLNPIDVVMTVLKPFDDEGIVLNADGTVDVLPNTPPGIYSALYEIRTGEEEVSTAEVTVEVVAFVTIAEDDLAKVDVIGDGNAILNVLDNDLLNGLPVNADEVRIGVVEDLSGGVLTLNLDGTLDVSVEAVPGTYQLIYELCDRERPSNCSRATVQVVINQADEGQVISLFIPNVITPGKLDGKNDRFVIRGIEEFQSSRITIFNRNGDHVFERENYLNDWSAEGLNGGPYYYVLWTLNTEGNEEVFKGWVHVIK